MITRGYLFPTHTFDTQDSCDPGSHKTKSLDLKDSAQAAQQTAFETDISKADYRASGSTEKEKPEESSEQAWTPSMTRPPSIISSQIASEY